MTAGNVVHHLVGRRTKKREMNPRRGSQVGLSVFTAPKVGVAFVKGATLDQQSLVFGAGDHPQSSTAVTHCVLVATHFVDPERMKA